MKKKLSLFLLITILAIFMAACGADNAKKEETNGASKAEKTEELTITHEFGETTVKKNPETVVVFDYGILDTLDTLGVEVAALPKDTIPTYLEKYGDDKYANVGSLKEPDFEKINEIQPDLIIISGRQIDLYEEFQEIAPTVYLPLDTTKYLESFKENTMTIGEIFGKEKEVEEGLAAIDEDIKALHEKATQSGKNALVILANDGKISAFGPSSRFGIIHDEFGVKPVDEGIEVSQHGQNISSEYIVENDPDYIFVVDRGAVVTEGGDSSAKDVVENELVKGTKAYKDGHIVYLDPNYWYLSGSGLVSITEMIKSIDEGLK